MRLQLDTNAKTIKVEEKVQISELVEVLEKLLPNGEWKQYQLDTNTVINWNASPTIIYRDRPFINPIIPYYQRSPFEVTCDISGNLSTSAGCTFTSTEGIQNIELQ